MHTRASTNTRKEINEPVATKVPDNSPGQDSEIELAGDIINHLTPTELRAEGSRQILMAYEVYLFRTRQSVARCSSQRCA